MAWRGSWEAERVFLFCFVFYFKILEKIGALLISRSQPWMQSPLSVLTGDQILRTLTLGLSLGPKIPFQDIMSPQRTFQLNSLMIP